MIKFIKKEIEIEESLKQRIMIICDFCNTKPTIINGSIRKKVLCSNSFLNKKYKTTKTIAIFINGKKDIGVKQIFIISKGKEINKYNVVFFLEKSKLKAFIKNNLLIRSSAKAITIDINFVKTTFSENKICINNTSL